MTDCFQPLTDLQWAFIAKFLPTSRKRKLCLREVMDAIRRLCRGGTSWRMLPKDCPNWKSVAYYFYRWQRLGVIRRINEALNKWERRRKGKRAQPRRLIVDSQSVKLSPFVSLERGFDGGKGVNGRKRQIFTDEIGLVWGVCVHAANKHDSIGALGLLPLLAQPWAQGVELVKCDRGYPGSFTVELNLRGINYEVPSWAKEAKSFVTAGGRWVIERTISWFSAWRRLDKERDYTLESAVAWILLANSFRLLNRMK